jgi:uncharacterized protein YbbK (DUF523 family)
VKPRVGISRCLLGDDVRYDGTNRRSAVVDVLAAFVEWVAVCPEVEVGMGVPREPIQLVRDAGGVRVGREVVRLRGVQSGEDWTDRMDRWVSGRVAELRELRISGFVLKARSPSCGPSGVLVHDDLGEATPIGRGLFAEALAAVMPGLPIIDEEALDDPRAREQFLQDVREFAVILDR